VVDPQVASFLSAIAAAAAALFGLVKGAAMLAQYFEAIRRLMAILLFLIDLAEMVYGAGTGPQKKAKVIADVQGHLPGLAADLHLPPGVVALFSTEAFLSMAIDGLVTAANMLGKLSRPPEAAPEAGK